MTTDTQKEKKVGFTTTSNKGFQITFENNWTISVQWGTGNYCDHHGYHGEFGGEMKTPNHFSTTAEIAIWDESGKWFDFGSDQVLGYCSPVEVGEWISKVSKF